MTDLRKLAQKSTVASYTQPNHHEVPPVSETRAVGAIIGENKDYGQEHWKHYAMVGGGRLIALDSDAAPVAVETLFRAPRGSSRVGAATAADVKPLTSEDIAKDKEKRVKHAAEIKKWDQHWRETSKK